MRHIRTLLIIIPSVIVVATVAGFVITFLAAPQAAIARIFIDLGVLICLVSACLMMPKPKSLRTADICDALRDLARGRYDRRLNSQGFEELTEVAQAFNELAGTLSDLRDPAISNLRQKYQRNENMHPVIDPLHSHHPEIGTVQVLLPKTMISGDSEPPANENIEVDEPSPTMPPQQDAAPDLLPEPSFVMPAQVETKSFAETVVDLYQKFAAAHLSSNLQVVDFEVFQNTVDRARQDLIAAHNCKDVRFEIVTDHNEIALRPRLIR